MKMSADENPPNWTEQETQLIPDNDHDNSVLNSSTVTVGVGGGGGNLPIDESPTSISIVNETILSSSIQDNENEAAGADDDEPGGPESDPEVGLLYIDPSSFPVLEMTRLDEMISNPRWVVPVLPGGQLEVLLDASINLCRRGLDTQSQPCQRFFRDGLTTSFQKILTDDAVSSWKPEIHKCIRSNSEKLIELIVLKLNQDWYPLLELLAILFNPSNKFHQFNSNRPPESYSHEAPLADDELYARPIDNRLVKGWLVDLINKFGELNGFQILKDRFTSENPLSVPLVFALLKPFGQCADYLTKHTIQKYFVPIFIAVPQFLENLTDDDLKKETAKSDVISSIIKFLKCLHNRLSESSEESMKNLELFRLRMILRMLQVSSFNGKMNALNEINQVIQNVQSYYPHHHHHQHHRLDEIEYLTGKRIAEWISENQVLQIVLRDSLHQPQYVEKLEKTLRFIIKEKTLTLTDLDDIWAAQVGKHDAIVKNLHDLLAKLAWDFSPEQLDHLFECFQASWTTTNKRQREKLLELIRRLAEDDKDGAMAHKVLTLFWNLARSNELPTEIMDQALTAHIKVLDYSCSQRDNQKYQWLLTSMTHLQKNDVDWVIPAMKHMREIFSLYPEGHSNHKNSTSVFRTNIINKMQMEKSLLIVVANSLCTYMEKVRAFIKDQVPDKGASCDPHQVKLDGRYSHTDQIRERLYFLRYILKEGRLYLIEDQAYFIWQSLAENPAFTADREMCFEWFSKLMGDEQDLDPKITQTFFERKILCFDPTLLTESGMNCFEKFFKNINTSKKKLSVKRDETMMEDIDLIGTDYIWKIILSGKEDMATRAIQFLRTIFTQLGTTLLPNQKEVHEDFLDHCFDRLKTSYDTILILEKDKDSINRVRQEVTRACRVLRVLTEYITQCDSEYGDERAFVPLYRAYRGRNFVIFIRFPLAAPAGRGYEDVEILTHTNETLAGLRRQIVRKFKENFTVSTSFKMDLYYSGDVLRLDDDRGTVGAWGLKDKMLLQAKVVYNNTTNSPDSSEESSGGSPSHYPNGTDGANIEAEEALPSVMMSMNEKRMEFLCQLCNLGSNLVEDRLRESARSLLSNLPPCRFTEKSLRNAFLNQTEPKQKPYNILFNTDPATVLYRLEVLYANLFPASMWDGPQTIQLLQMFFASGGASAVVEMLTKNNFIPLADMNTKRSAYLSVLRLTKAVLTILIQLLIKYENETKVIGGERLNVIMEASRTVPNLLQENILRRVSEIVSHKLLAMLKDSQNPIPPEELKELIKAAIIGGVPDVETVKIIVKLAAATASGSFSYFSADQHNANREPTEDDASVCEDALEVLTLGFVLNPSALDQAINDPSFKSFVRNVLFLSLSYKVRSVALDQFYAIATKASGSSRVLLYFIQTLFEIVTNTVSEIPHQSREVFLLLSSLLKYAASIKVHVPQFEQLLKNELEWLRQMKDYAKNNGPNYIQEELLEGHITITSNLVLLLSPEKRYQIGSQESPEGETLIQEIIEEFVFTWSKAYYDLKKTGEISSDQPVQVCFTGTLQNVMLDLLVALSTNSYPNLKLVVELLSKLFNYTNEGDTTITDWEYIPPIGSRPMGGFVGLKNAGATCYMNSVLQQLYMVENIRRGILCITTTDSEGEEGTDDSVDGTVISRCQSESSIQESISSTSAEERKGYNICILKQMQAIFGHLALSKLQYYVPSGLWKHFRLQGEAVNLREQQDAVEFFMSLVESVDDGLKALGHEQVMSKNLGGLFSDQKICKECPHRYSKEEPFSVISVDIRNHSNLLDSLEQYVKGELLEGADAYYCERCDKKVVTVKRLCVKKLPPVLAIQLKRFEYDYERLCPIKFNDYFEFPRDLDMEPYTVSGLAKIEGEIIDDDATVLDDKIITTYRLTGVVVHSGQASGGHYYSYISVKGPDGNWRWFKFDDGDVTEIRMDDDDELKTQCFGGDYSGEVFDHIMKRMSFRRQKRWWNAYILFYTQELLDPTQLATNLSKLSFNQPNVQQQRLIVPPSIERSVLRQNIEFMHSRSQFSSEYFFFIRKLVGCNTQSIQCQSIAGNQLTEEIENIAILSVQLATMFLFSIGFRTKKSLRGNTAEWFDVICHYLRYSKKVRFWFATYAIFRDPCRISEYLLECPSSEVRTTFCKLLVHLAHLSKNDGIYTPSIPMATLSRSADKNAHLHEYILEAVLNLLRRDVSEYGRHLVQYFTFFMTYANFGDEEKRHLLKSNVPSTFVLLAIEEGSCPPIKYQCADLSKLYQVVSTLVRSCDVSYKCRSLRQGDEILPNPYYEISIQAPIMQLPEAVYDIVVDRRHVKKLLEESYNSDDSMQLLQFLCWENPNFSVSVLQEILSHMGYTYTTELKSFLDVGMNILKIEDSWQLYRFEVVLKGTSEDNNGLIEIITRSRQTQPKRSYLFIKLITTIMEPNGPFHQIIINSPDHLKLWNQAVDWLQVELDRRAPMSCTSYAYTGAGWSPPSNEAVNGSFFLERSLSAKTTLHKAHLLRVDSVETVNAENDEEISSEGEGEEWSAVGARPESPGMPSMEVMDGGGGTSSSSTGPSVGVSYARIKLEFDDPKPTTFTRNLKDLDGKDDEPTGYDDVYTQLTTEYNRIKTSKPNPIETKSKVNYATVEDPAEYKFLNERERRMAIQTPEVPFEVPFVNRKDNSPSVSNLFQNWKATKENNKGKEEKETHSAAPDNEDQETRSPEKGTKKTKESEDIITDIPPQS